MHVQVDVERTTTAPSRVRRRRRWPNPRSARPVAVRHRLSPSTTARRGRAHTTRGPGSATRRPGSPPFDGLAVGKARHRRRLQRPSGRPGSAPWNGSAAGGIAAVSAVPHEPDPAVQARPAVRPRSPRSNENGRCGQRARRSPARSTAATGTGPTNSAAETQCDQVVTPGLGLRTAFGDVHGSALGGPPCWRSGAHGPPVAGSATVGLRHLVPGDEREVSVGHVRHANPPRFCPTLGAGRGVRHIPPVPPPLLFCHQAAVRGSLHRGETTVMLMTNLWSEATREPEDG